MAEWLCLHYTHTHIYVQADTHIHRHAYMYSTIHACTHTYVCVPFLLLDYSSSLLSCMWSRKGLENFSLPSPSLKSWKRRAGRLYAKTQDVTTTSLGHPVWGWIFFIIYSFTDAFKSWCWRGLLRVSWTARRSNESILKEINPEYLLEGLMLKLKLQ